MLCEIFLISKISVLVLGSIQAQVYWALIPQGQSGQGLRLIIHLHLVLRLRMSRATPPLPPVCLNGIQWDKIIFTLFEVLQLRLLL
jgi:hypothetical protein